MLEITCRICEKIFFGRPNRLYCSITCRRRAEFFRRSVLAKKKHDDWLRSLLPDERNILDSFDNLLTLNDICKDLPSVDEIFGDIKTNGNEWTF